MGWFLERELPIIVSSLVLPIGIFIGMYYTFVRASHETGIGTKIGYVVLGILLLLFLVDTMRHSTSALRSLF
jgi:hypothetical protein